MSTEATNTEPKFLAWIDLETSGTNEHVDQVLELALIVTENKTPFNELHRSSCVVRPANVWTMANDVLEMHTSNGLLTDVFDKGTSIDNVSRRVVTALGALGKPHDFVLAGSGVAHFDRRFIAAQMPKLDRWFRYYCIDVGILRRSLTMFGLGPLVDARPTRPAVKAHRAMADIEDHLDEFRWLSNQIEGAFALAPLGFSKRDDVAAAIDKVEEARMGCRVPPPYDATQHI